jgi:hypothetical protein
MQYSLGEAAKASGKSKATIHRAITSGRLSAARDESTGSWVIDGSELARAFPPVSPEHARNGTLRQGETAGETAETAVLRALLEKEQAERQRERAQLEGVIDDLRHRLDIESEERRRLTMLLTVDRGTAASAASVPSEPSQETRTETPAETVPDPPRRRWWHFGRRG